MRNKFIRIGAEIKAEWSNPFLMLYDNSGCVLGDMSTHGLNMAIGCTPEEKDNISRHKSEIFELFRQHTGIKVRRDLT
jgi:hypothetical protein